MAIVVIITITIVIVNIATIIAIAHFVARSYYWHLLIM